MEMSMGLRVSQKIQFDGVRIFQIGLVISEPIQYKQINIS